MRTLPIVLLSLGLLLVPVPPAEAGKSGPVGGKSASSGGRSSSGGKSYSSGGKSYTSGGSGGKSYTSPAGKSYTAGGSSTSGGGKTSYAAPVAKGLPPGPSARPASPSPPAPSARPGSPAPQAAPPAATSGPVVRVPTSQKPATASYDKLPAAEQKKAESRAAYVKAQEPHKTYTPPKGEPKPINPRDRQVERLRAQLDHERWVHRDLRERTFYTTYATRPVVIYSDPYNSFFWWWMLDRSLEERTYWAYHHRYDMDSARYQALLARDAQLEARLRQLEAEKVVRDPAYTPPALQSDPDLMYTDEYVNAVYSPQPAPVVIAPSPGGGYSGGDHSAGSYSSGSAGSSVGRVFFWIFLLLLIASVIWLGVWLVFYKRWNV